MAELFLVRPIHRISLTVIAIICVMFGGCEKPTTKFHPGDRVFVKANPKIRGVISMRLSPENHDLYYIAIQPGAVAPHPYLTEGDEFALVPPTRQYDGGYGESELELDHQ